MAKISIEATHAVLLEVKDYVKEIKEQTIKTNGRVNTLESRADKRDGAFGVIVWLLAAIGIPLILLLIDTYLI